MQSVLHAAALQAAHIESEWWTMFWVTTIVTLVVLLVLGIGIRRGLSGTPKQSPPG